MQRLPLSSFSLLLTGLAVALLTACGQKPDGTPYGVDPAKLPAARLAAARKNSRPPLTNDVPKGAELNAVTSSATTGQPQPAGAAPASPAPAAAPARL